MRQRWEVDDLIEWWTLDSEQRQLVANKTGATRLGFALLLKFFDIEARFPRSGEEVPVEVVDFIARQLDVSFNVLGAYDWSGLAGNGTGLRSGSILDSVRGRAPKMSMRR